MTADDDIAAVRSLVSSEPSSDADGSSTGDWLERLCRAATRDLEAAGVGVSLVSAAGDLMTAAASGVESGLVEELQFTLGEGPCIDAFNSRRPVLVPDLSENASTRWPGYAPSAHVHGVLAVFAFPLQVGITRLGALDVYRGEVGLMSPRTIARALMFAEVAMETLLGADSEAGELVSFAADVTSHRLEVYQAQGMVMFQLDVSAEHALALLRAHAYSQDRRIVDVANDVISRKVVLGSRDP
jgi:hypothetical protein